MTSNPNRVILILGSGKYWEQILEEFPVLYPSIQIVQASYFQKHPQVRTSRFCQISLGKELEEIQTFLFAHKLKPVAVYNRSDTYIQLHGQLVDRFGVPGPSEKSVNFFRLKNSLHKLMIGHDMGEYRPKTEIRHFFRVGKKFLQKLSYPVVVKPMIGAKSRGVFFLQKPQDYFQIQSLLTRHFDQENSVALANLDDLVLFEEFISGKQVSVTAYVDAKGKLSSISSVDVVTAHDLGLAHMQLIYRTTPSKYPEYTRQKMEFVLQKLVNLTGLRSTFIHPEFIVTRKKIYLIELNCRIAGFRYEMTKYAFELDINKMAIQLVMGEEVDNQPIRVRSCTACEIWAEKSGRIEQFALSRSKYIVDSSQRLNAGDIYQTPPLGNIPLGRFFVVSDSDDSLKISKKLRRQVKVRIES